MTRCGSRVCSHLVETLDIPSPDIAKNSNLHLVTTVVNVRFRQRSSKTGLKHKTCHTETSSINLRVCVRHVILDKN
jgi:hypothetical protein